MGQVSDAASGGAGKAQEGLGAAGYSFLPFTIPISLLGIHADYKLVKAQRLRMSQATSQSWVALWRESATPPLPRKSAARKKRRDT